MPEQQQKKVKAVKAVRVTAKEAAPQEQTSSTPPAHFNYDRYKKYF